MGWVKDKKISYYGGSRGSSQNQRNCLKRGSWTVSRFKEGEGFDKKEGGGACFGGRADILLPPFQNVKRMSISTISFLAQLDSLPISPFDL